MYFLIWEFLMYVTDDILKMQPAQRDWAPFSRGNYTKKEFHAINCGTLLIWPYLWWPHGESTGWAEICSQHISHFSSILPLSTTKKKAPTFVETLFLVTSWRIELQLSGWEPGVLTVRRWGQSGGKAKVCVHPFGFRAFGRICEAYEAKWWRPSYCKAIWAEASRLFKTHI